MRRRFMYALAGLLSSGAPTGLLGIRLAKEAESISVDRVQNELAGDRYAHMFLGAATAVIFAVLQKTLEGPPGAQA